eukprot:m.114717 g.114717  ORF g.114717 m.114717 type:complete len:303 (+) comp37520_c0_seq9:805-1713(+)
MSVKVLVDIIRRNCWLYGLFKSGLIDFLISSSPAARILRDNLVFKIGAYSRLTICFWSGALFVVPMLNPDGVFLGNYRCSLMGFDLNRHWIEPSPWAHPTLQATKSLVLQYDTDPSIDLDFYIDIHAHSTLMNGFMYGNVYDDAERFDRHSVFPKLLCANAADFSMDNTSYNKDAVKAGTARRFLGGCLKPRTNCYTLEVSFFSYTTGQHQSSPSPYTEDGYFQLGHNLAKTFLDYYNLHHLAKKGSRSTAESSPVEVAPFDMPPDSGEASEEKETEEARVDSQNKVDKKKELPFRYSHHSS